MKKLLAITAITIISSFTAFAQNEREEQKILKVFNKYIEAMQLDQLGRDKARELLLTDEYFYMGMDGLPAGKKLVMERQKRNGLKINSLKMTDIKIRVYGKTAILTMRSTGAGVDKGETWGGDGAENGHTTVMIKQKGIWRVAADIVGRDVEN